MSKTSSDALSPDQHAALRAGCGKCGQRLLATRGVGYQLKTTFDDKGRVVATTALCAGCVPRPKLVWVGRAA